MSSILPSPSSFLSAALLPSITLTSHLVAPVSSFLFSSVLHPLRFPYPALYSPLRLSCHLHNLPSHLPALVPMPLGFFRMTAFHMHPLIFPSRVLYHPLVLFCPLYYPTLSSAVFRFQLLLFSSSFSHALIYPCLVLVRPLRLTCLFHHPTLSSASSHLQLLFVVPPTLPHPCHAPRKPTTRYLAPGGVRPWCERYGPQLRKGGITA